MNQLISRFEVGVDLLRIKVYLLNITICTSFIMNWLTNSNLDSVVFTSVTNNIYNTLRII